MGGWSIPDKLPALDRRKQGLGLTSFLTKGRGAYVHLYFKNQVKPSIYIGKYPSTICMD
jgi:hypothetical protein